MSLFQRAWLYITRKKGRTLLMFCIFFIMASAIISGISIKKATQSAMQSARESVGGNFTLAINYGEDNPYMKQKESGSQFSFATMENDGPPLSKEVIKKIGEVQGIKYYNASKSLSIEANGLQAIEALKLEGDMIMSTGGDMSDFQLSANLNSQLNDLFQNKTLELIEGKHITTKDKHNILVHKKLAEKNGLKVGDKIPLKVAKSSMDKNQSEASEVEVEIVGIFDTKKQNETGVMSFMSDENTVYSDMETGRSLQNSDVFAFDSAKFFVKDPKKMTSIVDDVKTLDVDWKQFSIDKNDMQYQQIAGSIEHLDEMINIMLIAVILVSCVILVLILTLWMKGRIYETGILLSIGISKYKVMMQYISELLMIAFVAFALSFLSGKAVSQTIGNYMMDSLKQQQNYQGGMSVSSISSISLADASSNDEIKEIDVSVSGVELGYVYVIGTSIVVVSILISSMSLIRLKPKEILSKMS